MEKITNTTSISNIIEFYKFILIQLKFCTLILKWKLSYLLFSSILFTTYKTYLQSVLNKILAPNVFDNGDSKY